MNTPAASGGNSRLISLDLLRLLAVLLVLGHHMEAPPAGWQSPWATVIRGWNQGGSLGVELFFVLSGFLVSGLLFCEYKKYGEFSVKHFYIRRAWRIYPAFYTLIAFTYLAYFLRHQQENVDQSSLAGAVLAAKLQVGVLESYLDAGPGRALLHTSAAVTNAARASESPGL